MSAETYRLVYYSRNMTTGDADAVAAEVDDILATSRANNERDEITGALMFNAGCFAQVLEGPLDVVEAAFERIQQDDRHSEVSLLAMEPIIERSFPNWAMGFVGRSISLRRRQTTCNFAGLGDGRGAYGRLIGHARASGVIGVNTVACQTNAAACSERGRQILNEELDRHSVIHGCRASSQTWTLVHVHPPLIGRVLKNSVSYALVKLLSAQSY
jgi:hypothetical protein